VTQLSCDVLVVGAGFAGLVLAERLASQLGLRCIVIDKRAHVGGNAHDEYDRAGVLVHRHGPHYFRTNSPRVRDYLSQFTEWHPVAYRVLSHTEGRYWSFPINLRTYEQLVGRPSTQAEFEAYLAEHRVAIAEPKTSEDVMVSRVGHELYEKFFLGYTLKQWGRHPRELDASVCGRIPIRTTRDDRYVSDDFQALPSQGYHELFARMLAATPGARTLLGADFRELSPQIERKWTVYTGRIDEYFDECFGRLPYRSLRFEPESFDADQLRARQPIAGKDGFWQPEMQVNYPGPEPFTRIVEIKHATGQRCDSSTIVREYPAEMTTSAEPYYPVPTADSRRLYERYAARAALEPRTSFVGRLATYRYYNMDQVVAMALAEFERLRTVPELVPA
jgi:UDP-galactopyranose mutase